MLTYLECRKEMLGAKPDGSPEFIGFYPKRSLKIGRYILMGAIIECLIVITISHIV